MPMRRWWRSTAAVKQGAQASRTLQMVSIRKEAVCAGVLASAGVSSI